MSWKNQLKICKFENTEYVSKTTRIQFYYRAFTELLWIECRIRFQFPIRSYDWMSIVSGLVACILSAFSHQIRAVILAGMSWTVRARKENVLMQEKIAAKTWEAIMAGSCQGKISDQVTWSATRMVLIVLKRSRRISFRRTVNMCGREFQYFWLSVLTFCWELQNKETDRLYLIWFIF